MVKVRLNSETILSEARAYFFITLGLALYAVGFSAFLIPAKVVGGGVTGIGTLIYFGTGFKVAYSYFIINVFLLFLAIKILGANFGIKTIVGIGITSLFLWLGQSIIHSSPLNMPEDRLLATIIGGGMCGSGLGLVFLQGGSSGGTDIIAMIINKYRNVSIGRLILLIDVLIIGASYFVLQDFTSVVYGYITVGVVSFTIDMVLQGTRQTVQMFIISKKYETIANRLSTEVRRGVTVLDGQGWYSKEKQQIVMVLVRKNESNMVFRICKQEDPDSFITVVNAMGVFGKGFDVIKTK